MYFLRAWLLLVSIFVVSAAQAQSVAEVFGHNEQTRLIMHIEASMAEAQAKHGIIPQWAAEEIRAKADPSLVTEAELKAAFSEVRHRMIAMLKAWGSKMDNGAEQYVHYGATTVDIYDTLMALQLIATIEHLQTRQLALETKLMALAKEHATTIMPGRTLGQHALPITFGKKVTSWLAENRRHINRLKTVREKLRHSAILKGAVGSYLGLGEKGPAVEQDFAIQLGLKKAYADDWHASRDVFAEYAMVLAMMSKSLQRLGQEIFLMQSTDLGEVYETRVGNAVSSSSMPHKKNPSRSEALILAGRTIPAQAEVILDDMVNFYERDNTGGPNGVLASLSIAADDMLKNANLLVKRLVVYPKQMRENLNKTKGLITAQRIVMALAPHMGKQHADELIIKIARQTYASEAQFVDVLLQNTDVTKHLSETDIRELTDVATYRGEDEALVEAVLDWVKSERNKDASK